jgi:hypothetical protein
MLFNADATASRTHSPMLIHPWSVTSLICSYCSGGIDIVNDFVKIACFMIFPPFLFLITRMGTYPCIYMLLALGDEAGQFETAIKKGTTPLVETAPIPCNTAIRSL